MTNNTYYYAQILNTKEANRIQDEHNKRMDAETAAHNRAQEDFNLSNLAETKRHYEALENLQQQEIDERVRAARAQEMENLRAHIAQETENIRSHKAQEQENKTWHAVTEAIERSKQSETQRHDSALERIQKQKNDNDYELGLAKQVTENWYKKAQVGLSEFANTTGRISAYASRVAADARMKQAENSEKLVPYQQWQYTTQSILNASRSVESASSTVKNVLSWFNTQDTGSTAKSAMEEKRPYNYTEKTVTDGDVTLKERIYGGNSYEQE